MKKKLNKKSKSQKRPAKLTTKKARPVVVGHSHPAPKIAPKLVAKTVADGVLADYAGYTRYARPIPVPTIPSGLFTGGGYPVDNAIFAAWNKAA